MKIFKKIRFFHIFIFSLLFVFSCETDNELKIDIQFRHFVDQNELEFNNLIYQNEAGNSYSIERLLYVISDLTLYLENGDILNLDNYYFINLNDDINFNLNNINITSPCVSISFTYGFSQENNLTNLYLNDSGNFHDLMLWPNTMGGGYHYMKLEGKYLDNYGQQKFYNTHTGGLNSNDYSVDYFFDIEPTKDNSRININMNINNIYNNPIYDFNYYGSAIMNNEEAQSIIQINMLDDIFTISDN